MSLPMRAGVALVVVDLVLLALPAGERAGAHPQQAEGTKTKRTVYFVKNLSVPLLAPLVEKHFKTSGVQVVAEQSANALLIRANADVFDEVLATLAQLDRRPQGVAIEITLVQVAPRKGEGGKLEPGDVDDRELSGSAERVQEQIAALQKKGVLTAVRRYTLRGLENMPAELENRQTTPNASGGGFSKKGKGGGFGADGPRIINYRDAGINLTVTPRLHPDKKITLEMQLRDVTAVTPEDGIVAGVDDKGAAIMAQETVVTAFEGRVTLTAGQAKIAAGGQSGTKPGTARTLVIVTAKVVTE